MNKTFRSLYTGIVNKADGTKYIRGAGGVKVFLEYTEIHKVPYLLSGLRSCRLTDNGYVHIEINDSVIDRYNSLSIGFGFKFLFTAPESDKLPNQVRSYAKHPVTALILGSHTKLIYNLATKKLQEGFIGLINSRYNQIPILAKDCILLNDEAVTGGFSYNPYILCDDHDENTLLKKRDDSYLLDLKNTYKNCNRIKQVPLWCTSPSINLLYSLRILASHIVAKHVQHNRHLFLGIVHYKNVAANNRIILLSYLPQGIKITPLRTNEDYSYLVNGNLKEYDGYTENLYISWYYLPVLKPIEYCQFIEDSDYNISTLPVLKAY